jgi:hypothetical protein
MCKLFVRYQQNRYPIFITKPPTKTNITAHGPSQPAHALLRSKLKLMDKRLSPSQRSSASSDPSPSRLTPVTSSRRPSPVTSSRRSTPLHSYCFAQPPYCNTLPQACTGPYLFLLRNRSSQRHAGLPGNLQHLIHNPVKACTVLSHPHGSNREKLCYAAPYHVHLNGTRSNGRPGTPPFRRRSFRATKSSSS